MERGPTHLSLLLLWLLFGHTSGDLPLCKEVRKGFFLFFFCINDTTSLKRSSAQLLLALNVNLNLFLKLLRAHWLCNKRVNFNFSPAKNGFAVGAFLS